jgi:hypothetical protein
MFTNFEVNILSECSLINIIFECAFYLNSELFFDNELFLTSKIKFQYNLTKLSPKKEKVLGIHLFFRKISLISFNYIIVNYIIIF